MSHRDALLSRLRTVNPVPTSRDLPADLADARPPLGWLMEENPFMPEAQLPRRSRLIPLVAALLGVAALITVPLLVATGGDETVATTTTAATGPAIVPATSAMAPLPGSGVSAISTSELWVPATSTEVTPGVLLRQGVAHWVDGQWHYYELNAQTSRGPAQVHRVAVAPDGNVWVATEIGLFAFDGTTWKRHIDSEIAEVAVGPDGRVWIGGVRGTGLEFWLAYLDDDEWIGWDPPMGHTRTAGTIRISPLPNGVVWICSLHGWWSVCESHDATTRAALPASDSWTRWYEQPAGSYIGPLAFALAPDGTVWAGGCLVTTSGTGGLWIADTVAALARFDGTGWPLVEMPTGLGLGLIHTLEFAPDGTLWLEGTSAVASFDGSNWDAVRRTIRAIDVLPDGTVVYLTSDGEVGVMSEG